MSEKKGFNRRDFLKVIGATTGLAAAGCTKEVPEKLIPYVIQPDEIIPGIATWYSGSCFECSAGCGIMVKTREGRAIKIEGNPNHPINRGGLCATGQSALQSMYDPDRVREPLKRNIDGAFKPISWSEAIKEISEALGKLPANQEAVLITNPLSGSQANLADEFVKKIPKTKRIQYRVFGNESLDRAAEISFGSGVRTTFDFSQADAIVSFGADFLETWISPVQFAKDWSRKRKPRKGSSEISFFSQIEPRLSLTAANADKWIMNKPGSEENLLLALLSEVVSRNSTRVSPELKNFVATLNPEELVKGTSVELTDIVLLGAELARANSSLVLAGGASVSGEKGVRCQVIANAINVALGNIGKTVLLLETNESNSLTSLAKLNGVVEEMNEKKVGVAILSGVNPAYSLSDKIKFSDSLAKVGLVVAVSSHIDETSTLANLILPLSHSLESWLDAEPVPGVWNLSQPSMRPIYQTQSLGDSLISILAKLDISVDESASFQDYIKKSWEKRLGSDGFEARWLRLVEKGGEFSPKNVDKRGLENSAVTFISSKPTTKSKSTTLSLLAYPSVNSFDGGSANRPWMQELPNPITTAVWGSWVEVHPDTATKLGIPKKGVVRVETENGTIDAPVYLNKFIHPEMVAIPVGQGHESMGRYASGIGANVLKVTDIDSMSDALLPTFVVGVSSLKSVPWKEELITTQMHDSQEGRKLIRTVKASEADKEEKGGHHGGHGEPKQMYKQMEHPLYRWAMAVDLASCTGCSACVVACYAENNVPVVGRELCSEGREMSWIRIDRYSDGPKDQPITGFSPMMCQHCGNAPCEPVCPVYATYHNEEGLNAMVYNRCVGTRYCSNNCSYKVRRFNWFKYDWPEPLNWQLNPDITVREVGVMEKCSFCVQRIAEVENKAKDLGRKVKDGEVQPACASSCPTNAITFGNLLDKKSEVAKKSKEHRAYKVLDHEINTQPAVTYLARLRNDRA